MLYFAYGSNLNLKQMATRCPNAELISIAKIPDYKLVFRGVADVTPAPGEVAMGGLFEITQQCERALDIYEGFPTLYEKKYFKYRIDGVPRLGMFYYMTTETPGLRGLRDRRISSPSPGYYRSVEQGYQDWDLDTGPLEKALTESGSSIQAIERTETLYTKRQTGRITALFPREEEEDDDTVACAKPFGESFIWHECNGCGVQDQFDVPADVVAWCDTCEEEATWELRTSDDI